MLCTTIVSVPVSQRERVLAPATLVGWRWCGNMREAHVATPPPPLARRSRVSSATKEDSQNQTRL
ncbi:MAG TPA: hypothetical protein VFB60_00970 [Ktedonobacteraceae bacterium]|nr:hypothetical protein [Ktedonobacteraceae bacterium]